MLAELQVRRRCNDRDVSSVGSSRWKITGLSAPPPHLVNESLHRRRGGSLKETGGPTVFLMQRELDPPLSTTEKCSPSTSKLLYPGVCAPANANLGSSDTICC